MAIVLAEEGGHRRHRPRLPRRRHRAAGRRDRRGQATQHGIIADPHTIDADRAVARGDRGDGADQASGRWRSSMPAAAWGTADRARRALRARRRAGRRAHDAARVARRPHRTDFAGRRRAGDERAQDQEAAARQSRRHAARPDHRQGSRSSIGSIRSRPGTITAGCASARPSARPATISSAPPKSFAPAPTSLVIDIAHGHSLVMERALEQIRKRFDAVDVVAGNVATAEGAQVPARARRQRDQGRHRAGRRLRHAADDELRHSRRSRRSCSAGSRSAIACR